MSNLTNMMLNFNEIFDALEADGRNVTMLLEGEPGVGKSTIGAKLAEKLGYHFAYLDIANMSLGDLMYPVPNREAKCIELYPNEALKLHLGGPVVIMLDEWTKGTKEVKNMTLPLALERRLGSVKLHPDSIVFATGNMSRDGVGDSIQAHQRNRFVPVYMRKPTAEEWINNYAVYHDVDPTVIAFVDQFPQVMQSYLDDPNNENGYIFNPKKQQQSYASPRSLKFASDLIKTRESKTTEALHAQLVGAVGAVAAADMINFVRMNEELPPLSSIIADPTGTKLPEKPVNRLLLMFNLLMRSEKTNIEPILTYMQRMNNEIQAVFLHKLMSTTTKAAWAVNVFSVTEAVQKLHKLF